MALTNSSNGLSAFMLQKWAEENLYQVKEALEDTVSELLIPDPSHEVPGVVTKVTRPLKVYMDDEGDLSLSPEGEKVLLMDLLFQSHCEEENRNLFYRSPSAPPRFRRMLKVSIYREVNGKREYFTSLLTAYIPNQEYTWLEMNAEAIFKAAVTALESN